jgi:hypothetical protein
VIAKAGVVGERVPRLRRSHGTPGQAGASSIANTALPGWADVWRTALRALNDYQIPHSVLPSQIASANVVVTVKQTGKELIWTTLKVNRPRSTSSGQALRDWFPCFPAIVYPSAGSALHFRANGIFWSKILSHQGKRDFIVLALRRSRHFFAVGACGQGYEGVVSTQFTLSRGSNKITRKRSGSLWPSLFSTAVPLIAPELLLIGRVKAVALRFGSSGHSPLMSPAPFTGGETPGLPSPTHLFVQER